MFVLIILICMGIYGFTTSWVTGTPKWLKGVFGVLLTTGLVVSCFRIAAITKSIGSSMELSGNQQSIKRPSLEDHRRWY